MKTQISMALLLAFGTTAALADTPAKPAPAPDAKKAPAPPTPAPDAKKAPEPKKEPAKAAEMPKPPQELVDAAKAMTGTWKCTGKAAMDPANPTVMSDTKATIVNKLDLDKWWIQSTFTAPMGKMTYKFVGYTTYNAPEKKWYRYMVDNMGGGEMNSSTGSPTGTMVWEGEGVSQMPGMTKMKVRHTEDRTDPKAIKMKGEMSMDGKTWMAGYEATCKK